MEGMKYRRRTKSRPLEESGDVVYRALKQAGFSDYARRLKIFQSWDEAVGSDIAARTMPQSFSRGVLTIKAATATWQNELVFLRVSIMSKLNGLLGKNMVRDLKIISGHLEPRREAHVPADIAPAAEDYAIARETSLPIDDPEIKEAFERLMAKDRCAKRDPEFGGNL
jgi:predicted nucleic acid-binding Zn ribbon protein